MTPAFVVFCPQSTIAKRPHPTCTVRKGNLADDIGEIDGCPGCGSQVIHGQAH